MTPKVSIIIPTYKRHQIISDAVSKALGQNYPNIEILVIDDNGIGTESQEKTYEVLKPIMTVHDNVRYICLDKNSGVCKARNQGIREAMGEFIAFLDDDDIWHPDFIKEMLYTLNEECTDIIYSNFYRIDEQGIFYNRHENYFSGNIFDKLINGWCPATTSLFCIKKSLLMENEGFNENLKNLEEYDLWIRLSRNNRFSFCKKRLVIKNEFSHEQLTSNYSSRIKAWEQLKQSWSKSTLSLSEKENFLEMIDENIISDNYHKDLQYKVRPSHNQIKKYGIKRASLILLTNLFGLSFIIKLKHSIATRYGGIQYLPREEEKTIKEIFSISTI